MQNLHIAGLVIAALLAVWAIYVVATRGEKETYGGTFGRLFGNGVLYNRPANDAEHPGITPGIAHGAEGRETGAVTIFKG